MVDKIYFDLFNRKKIPDTIYKLSLKELSWLILIAADESEDHYTAAEKIEKILKKSKLSTVVELFDHIK